MKQTVRISLISIVLSAFYFTGYTQDSKTATAAATNVITVDKKEMANKVKAEFLHPSAILAGIDIAALLIWLVKPYNSSFGKCLVTL